MGDDLTMAVVSNIDVLAQGDPDGAGGAPAQAGGGPQEQAAGSVLGHQVQNDHSACTPHFTHYSFNTICVSSLFVGR